MLREPTLDKLHALRLRTMAAAWDEQQRSPDVVAMSFDERLALLVDAEWMARENDRVGRALKEAKLRIAGATIEGLDYAPARELDRTLVRHLASGMWVQQHQTVLVTGATGTGKTYVSCALAQQACRKGFRALYRRAPRFFDELRLARADGSYPRLLARVARVDVLVLDDFAIAPVTDLERRDLLEVLEDRYGLRSTVISSQLPPDRWHDYLGEVQQSTNAQRAAQPRGSFTISDLPHSPVRACEPRTSLCDTASRRCASAPPGGSLGTGDAAGSGTR